MKEIFARFALPAAFGVSGLVLVIMGQAQGQNGLFLLGGISIIAVALIILLNSLNVINNMLSTVLAAVLGIVSIALIYFNFQSINEPIQFMNQKKHRYQYVIQRLKDIREAEIAYKKLNGNYTASFDTLKMFLMNDSIPVIKKDGTVPDTLSQEEAIELKILKIDTSLVPASKVIFNDDYLKTRIKGFLINIDSLSYVPFTSEEYVLKAGKVSRSSGLEVPVFVCKDGAPFDKFDVMQVGSMIEPTTAGNWKEEK